MTAPALILIVEADETNPVEQCREMVAHARPGADRSDRLSGSSNELDGDHYEILRHAADALASKYPLAATMMLGAMIDFSLKNGRASDIGTPRAT